MKKLWALAIVGVFMLGSGLALAQEMKGECPGPPEKKMEQKREDRQTERLNRLAKDLNLTAEQKDKIGAIFKENETKAKAAMDKTREEMKTLRDAGEKKIKAVLTPEQAKKFEEMQAEMRKKMGEGKGKGRMEKREKCHPDDGPPPEEMPLE